MSARPQQWPVATKELLPKTLFRLAALHPDLTYSEYPCNPTNAADGYFKVTYKQLANAVHAVAWWIEENVGRPAKDDGSETIVYMGPNDLRYSILVLGSVMVGYKMLFPTPRYGQEPIIRLIESANGNVMLVPSTPFPVVSEILARRAMRKFDFPAVNYFLSASTSPYPYTKDFETSKHEPLVCLHTSGTTGFPKPIIWTNNYVNSAAVGMRMAPPQGFERTDSNVLGPQKRILPVFPPFHASGIITALFFTLFLGTTIVYPPSAMTPSDSVHGISDALDVLGEQGRVDSLALPPPHVEYLATNKPLLDKISQQARNLLFGGGDVSLAAGKAVSQKLQMFNQMASTELGLWLQLARSKGSEKQALDDDWKYMIFDPALNIRFDEVSDGVEGKIYEAFIVKNKGEGAWVQPLFKIKTDEEELSLGDLFTRHPHDPEKWRYYGRSDDLLVFLSTLLFHPGAAERRIGAHLGVAEVLMVGHRRPKASLIVRLNEGTSVDDIWDVIEDVNKDVLEDARVGKHMILGVKEPFLKTAKGTIQKKAVVDLYEKEIDALYQKDGSYVPVR
ncbi:hypothetical protein ACN47E_009005 [Coniothyrium glycines]